MCSVTATHRVQRQSLGWQYSYLLQWILIKYRITSEKTNAQKKCIILVLARWSLILRAVKSKNCFLKLLELSGKFACIPSWSEVSGNISGTCIGISWYPKILLHGVFWDFCLLIFVLFYSMISLGSGLRLARIDVSDCFPPPCPSLSN